MAGNQAVDQPIPQLCSWVLRKQRIQQPELGARVRALARRGWIQLP